MKIKNKKYNLCKAITKSTGLACQARVVLEDGFCRFHSPTIAPQRKAIASLAGKSKRGMVLDISHFIVRDSRDALVLTKKIIEAMGRKKEMSPSELKVFPSLLREMRELESQCELIQKLEKLESKS